ncbi:MAG: hypothetical protein AB1696_25075 [Planctomycetota bacterium]
MTKCNESQRKQIAETVVACGGDLIAAHAQLRMNPAAPPPSLATICDWIEKNAHDFRAEIEVARRRARRCERCQAIAAAERMARAIRGRIALWQFEHDKRFSRKGQAEADAPGPDGKPLSRAAKINDALIKLVTNLRQSAGYLLCLKHPKEGDAAKEAVDRFVRMLIAHATPEQREAIAAVTKKLLSEDAA